jgi:hypothetical protein
LIPADFCAVALKGVQGVEEDIEQYMNNTTYCFTIYEIINGIIPKITENK